MGLGLSRQQLAVWLKNTRAGESKMSLMHQATLLLLVLAVRIYTLVQLLC